MMFHYIYKTTNTLNGHYYIGCRSTKKEPLKDGDYYGSGKWIYRSKRKYKEEFENVFHKEILFLCPNKKTKFNCERWIVTEELLDDPLNMNMALGGNGGNGKGWKHSEEAKRKISENLKGNPKLATRKGIIETEETRKKKSESKRGNKNPMFGKEKNIRITNNLEEKLIKRGEIIPVGWRRGKKNIMIGEKNGMFGKGHLISGEKHGMFGKMWITNEIQSKLIKKEDLIPENWRKGRRIYV